MAKPEWGTKRICQGCGQKFYDMKREPITCPSCGVAFDPNSVQRTRRPRGTPAKVVKPVVEPEEKEALEDEELDTMVEDDNDVIVETDDLDDDDDEISGMVVDGDEEGS